MAGNNLITSFVLVQVSVTCSMPKPIVYVEIKEFRCYEVKIEEREKASGRRESNPGHLFCEGWWLSGCRGSMAEVSWVRLPLFSPHDI